MLSSDPAMLQPAAIDGVLLSAVAASLIIGFVLAAASTWLVRKLARRFNFVDRPGGHKGHDEPVALGGGIAITIAIVAPIAGLFGAMQYLLVPDELPSWIPAGFAEHLPGLLSRSGMAFAIAGGAVVLHILGIIDDRKPLGPWVKLFIEVAVAATLVVGFDLRLMTAAGYIPSVVATVLWIVLIVNAFNFLDNMDGLCAGVAAISAGVFALSAIRVDQLFVPALAFLVVGTMLGFLIFNFPPAKIFMGDAGSLVIGYFLAIIGILTTFYDPDQSQRMTGLLVPIVVLAVPLYDTASVFLIRLRLGINPFRGDQRHFSHRLVQRGMSPISAVLTIYLATIATSLGATLLPNASWPVVVVVVAQCACVVLIIAVLEQVKTNDSA